MRDTDSSEAKARLESAKPRIISHIDQIKDLESQLMEADSDFSLHYVEFVMTDQQRRLCGRLMEEYRSLVGTMRSAGFDERYISKMFGRQVSDLEYITSRPRKILGINLNLKDDLKILTEKSVRIKGSYIDSSRDAITDLVLDLGISEGELGKTTEMVVQREVPAYRADEAPAVARSGPGTDKSYVKDFMIDILRLNLDPEYFEIGQLKDVIGDHYDSVMVSDLDDDGKSMLKSLKEYIGPVSREHPVYKQDVLMNHVVALIGKLHAYTKSK